MTRTLDEEIVGLIGRALACVKIAAALPGVRREYDFEPLIIDLTAMYKRLRDTGSTERSA